MNTFLLQIVQTRVILWTQVAAPPQAWTGIKSWARASPASWQILPELLWCWGQGLVWAVCLLPFVSARSPSGTSHGFLQLTVTSLVHTHPACHVVKRDMVVNQWNVKRNDFSLLWMYQKTEDKGERLGNRFWSKMWCAVFYLLSEHLTGLPNVCPFVSAEGT